MPLNIDSIHILNIRINRLISTQDVISTQCVIIDLYSTIAMHGMHHTNGPILANLILGCTLGPGLFTQCKASGQQLHNMAWIAHTLLLHVSSSLFLTRAPCICINNMQPGHIIGHNYVDEPIHTRLNVFVHMSMKHVVLAACIHAQQVWLMGVAMMANTKHYL